MGNTTSTAKEMPSKKATPETLIKIAVYLECELAFITGSSKIALSVEDLKG